MLHAEAMLLIHDDEAQAFERDVGAKQPVCADDDVDAPLRELLEHCLLFLRRLKPAEHRDAHGKIRESLAERARVLVSENRRRNEYRDLALRLHGLERRTHRDFGLSIADVPDKEPIHRTRRFHVFLDVGRCLALIGRVLEEERRLELRLPRRIRSVWRPRRDATARVQIQELDCHFANRRARLLALLTPAFSAELVQSGRRTVFGDVGRGSVSLELIDAIQWHVEAIAALVFQNRDLERALSGDDRLDATVDPDAVLEMDDVISLAQR